MLNALQNISALPLAVTWSKTLWTEQLHLSRCLTWSTSLFSPLWDFHWSCPQ